MANIEKNGDKFNWEFRINNTSDIDCFNIKVVFTIPDGISLIGPIITGSTAIEVPQGAYDKDTNTWHVGNLSANKSTNKMILEFRVDDIEKAIGGKFIIIGAISSTCTSLTNYDFTATLDCEPVDVSITTGSETSDKSVTISSKLSNKVNISIK